MVASDVLAARDAVPGDSAASQEAVGRLVGGRYRLLSVVGRGGMSVVYAARDVTLNKLWAVKRCQPRGDEAGMLAAFRAEAQFIKRFDHPCIPRIVDLVEDPLGLFVVMDYVEGTTLRAMILGSGPQPAAKVVDWALQLCDVLEYLHGRRPPVVHRDIKPGNVMITPEGRIRLIDFGIASDCSMPSTCGEGTPGFSAPEQLCAGRMADGAVCEGSLAAHGTDPRVDVYAVGATLYAALTARHPRDGVDWTDVACDWALRHIVERCMEDSPQKRFASCAHVAYALRHCDDGAFRMALRRRWRGFAATSLCAALALGASPCCAIAARQVRSNDYSQWMMTARLSVNADDSWQAYRRAIDASAAHTEPYEEMIRMAKTDGVFDAREESDLCDELAAHAGELESEADGWGRLCYDMGILYWYYADAEDECGAGAATDACLGWPRSHAMEGASSWMKQAVLAGGFEEAGSAQVYADIADFSTQVVQRANEGTDRGMYRVYFGNLVRMLDEAVGDANPVVALTAAGQTVAALQVYPRHFRYDAVSLDQMRELGSRATQLALRTEAIGQRQTQMKMRVLRTADDSRRAVEEAFSDPGAGSRPSDVPGRGDGSVTSPDGSAASSDSQWGTRRQEERS